MSLPPPLQGARGEDPETPSVKRGLMKSAFKGFWILLALLGLTGLLRATLPQIFTGTWSPAVSLLQARSGAPAAMLSDGHVLIIGGDAASGPLQTAEFFGVDGTLSAAATMNAPRTGHRQEHRCQSVSRCNRLPDDGWLRRRFPTHGSPSAGS